MQQLAVLYSHQKLAEELFCHVTFATPDRNFRHSVAARYLVAALASAVVIALRAALDPLLGGHLPYVTLFLGVVFSAWYCGAGPAAMTTVVSLLAADYLFNSPRRSLIPNHLQQVAGEITFLLISGLIIALGERNRRTVSDLNNAAREVEHARNLFKVFMDNSPAIAYLRDEQGHFVFYNARARNKFKLPDQTDRPDISPSLAEMTPEFVENDAIVMREGKPRQFNERTAEPDGDRYWLSFRFPVVDSTGRRLVGSKSFDITEQRQAQEALRQSEERFRAIVETANEGIWLIDRQARTLYANQRLTQLLGYSADEIIGRTVTEFCYPEDIETARKWLTTNMEGGAEQFDFRLQRKDGSEVFTLASTSPVRDGSGNIIAALGMFSDITDRRRAAEALRETQERLILAQQAGRIAVWEWDLRSDRVTLFRDIPVLATFSGTNDGHLWRRTVHPDDRGRVAASVRQAIDSCGEYDAEYRVVGFSDPPAWIAVRARVIADGFGRPVRVLGIATDVTERKRTEAALIQSQKLASAGRMAATVAHEINNPLEAVFNLLYLALMDRSLAPETRRTLETADQELQRVAQITKQTLGFYRERSSPSTVNVCELMDQVLRLFARRLEAKNISVSREYAADVNIEGIPGELRQVFSNLVANSLEAVEQRGTVRVRISRMMLGGNSHVRITIGDTGVGICPEHVRNIFEPFFTTKNVGTGLGLWVSDNIVKNHGGVIKVRSKQGKGTVVCVYLPAHASKEILQQPAVA